jgi:hypothetical protein
MFNVRSTPGRAVAAAGGRSGDVGSVGVIRVVRGMDSGPSDVAVPRSCSLMPAKGRREASCLTVTGKYRYAPHNDVSVNDGPHIRRWSHKIIIQ